MSSVNGFKRYKLKKKKKFEKKTNENGDTLVT